MTQFCVIHRFRRQCFFPNMVTARLRGHAGATQACMVLMWIGTSPLASKLAYLHIQSHPGLHGIDVDWYVSVSVEVGAFAYAEPPRRALY
jgi:hypothetical protein